MRPNGVRDAWAADRPALGAWLMVPSSFSAEIIAHAGFDWVCVDMQHGIIDYAQMVTMLQAISSTATTPLVRVPWNEPGIIGKSLDAGARGVIIPMVNSRADAERAVRACRYAPAGARSYGPVRANYSAGFDYFAHANEDVLCIVMVETARSGGGRRRHPLGPGHRRRVRRPRRPQRHPRPAARPRPGRRELHRRDHPDRRLVPCARRRARASPATRRPRPSASSRASGW